MQIDVITTFPDYLKPLELSLVGRAIADEVIALRVHDLREFTADRHRSVDDSPYGGGPGMVMLAEPWALALTHVAGEATVDAGSSTAPQLVVPSPAGEPMTQQLARQWAVRDRLVFG